MTTMKKVTASVLAAGVLALPGVAHADGGNQRNPPPTVPAKTSNESARHDSGHQPSTVGAFDALKAKCLRMIDERLTKLSKAETQLAANPGPHAAALQALIDNAQAALATVKTKIDANTADLATLKADCASIPALHVLSLRIPQINLVMSFDKINATLPALDQLAADLTTAVDAATTAGDPDATEAADKLAKLKSKIASLKAGLLTIDVSEILAITPAQYDANKKVLNPSVDALRNVQRDAKTIRNLAHEITELLAPGHQHDEE
jgi:hypothetical protein